MNDINSERAGPSASLTWYGQAGFRLAAGNSRVLIGASGTSVADAKVWLLSVASGLPDKALRNGLRDPSYAG